MPTVKFKFPGGRYHATPWGHHVNEGLIEWPPSPWRLLRALIACGFSSQGWTEIPQIARGLFEKLATVLPLYRLPAASAAHSRHFMPCIESKAQKTTMVFDTWANVGDGEMLIHWPCALNAEESELLSRLVTSLGYLGRSESWVEAQLTNDYSVEWNAVPCIENEHRGLGWEQVSLMAAISPGEYSAWQKSQVEKVNVMLPLPEGKKKPTAKLLKDRDKTIEPYPPDIISCLTKDTEWWKGLGWSQPPGSNRVFYWRPRDTLQIGVPFQSKKLVSPPITTMLLALSTQSGNQSALPSCTRTLPQAELFHRAIIARLGKGKKVNCPELTGKTSLGDPLHDHHEHSHTFPVDLDGDGHLDHLIIYAKMGLTDIAQHAITSLKRTWTKGGVGEIQIALAGCGDISILRTLLSPLDKNIEKLLGTTIGTSVWESATPFVPPRFLKRRGKNCLLGQINAELVSRKLPEAQSVEMLPPERLKSNFRHFVRCRKHGGSPPPVDTGFWLRLTFSEPIKGPLAIGYASHYGLGLFHAVIQ